MTRNGKDQEAPKSRKDRIAALVVNIEKRLGSKDTKASVADFIRLMQFERELEEEQPREMKVSWSESPEMYEIDE